jgi:HAD superfamily hydrolase (TIGR01549 family)
MLKCESVRSELGIELLKAVIFDLDGTITKLILPLEEMRDDTKKFFIDKGLPSDLVEPADGISSTKHKALTYFEERGLTPEEWNKWCEDLDVVLDSHETETAERVELIEESLGVVDQIKELGLKTAILTNSGRHAVDIIVKKVQLKPHFELIQTRSESNRPKPYPDGIHQVIEKLGITMDEAIYVGDATIDGVASKKAGIEFWGVTTGETPAEVLLKVGASKVFNSLHEVLQEIKAHIKK